MERMWLTRTDRIDTLTRGATAGLMAGALLAAFEMAAAALAGHGLLWPWRMAASVFLGREAFVGNMGVAFFVGALVHLSLSLACGAIAAMLYEWSEWSRIHRSSPTMACLAGAGFGAMVWFVNFPLIAEAFLPWMWRFNHQGVQFALHLGYGVALGVTLRALERATMTPPESALPE
jgi:hypothetical protein